jgi:hypothetical protein
MGSAHPATGGSGKHPRATAPGGPGARSRRADGLIEPSFQPVGPRAKSIPRAATRREFLRRLRAAGAELAPGAQYRDANTKVKIICGFGHIWRPRPAKVNSGVHPCGLCSKAGAGARFWEQVEKQGGKRTRGPGSAYRGIRAPVRVVCGAAGHICVVKPTKLAAGAPLCRICAGSTTFSRLYLLRHEEAGAIKVGIAASHTRRISTHRGKGYQLIAEWRDLDHAVARTTEQDIICWWRRRGWPPADGVPSDGYSETTDIAHLAATRRRLVSMLGTPSRTGRRAT